MPSRRSLPTRLPRIGRRISRPSTDDAPVLESETIEYSVVDVPPEYDVEFVDCQRAEITGTFEDGETVIVATSFYESSGFGNTMGEYAITLGDDVEAPLEGTIVFEIGEEFDVLETDEGRRSRYRRVSSVRPSPGSVRRRRFPARSTIRIRTLRTVSRRSDPRCPISTSPRQLPRRTGST